MKMLFGLVLLSLAVLAPVQSITVEEQQIIANAQYPYIVQIENKKQFICTGTVVSSTYILTARPCIEDVAVEDLTVLVGASSSSEGFRREVIRKSYLTHSAVVRLDSELPSIQLLNVCKQAPQQSETLNILGWKHSGQSVSNEVQVTYSSVTPNESCELRENYGPDFYYLSGCYNTAVGQGSCLGDLGAPLVLRGELCGIVKHSASCGDTEDILGEFGDVREISMYLRIFERSEKNNPEYTRRAQ